MGRVFEAHVGDRMSVENRIRVDGCDIPFTLIVEPWANEFTIALGDRCEVVARHPHQAPTFGLELAAGDRVIVTVNESGSSFEFWRNGRPEFSTTMPIPYLSG